MTRIMEKVRGDIRDGRLPLSLMDLWGKQGTATTQALVDSTTCLEVFER